MAHRALAPIGGSPALEGFELAQEAPGDPLGYMRTAMTLAPGRVLLGYVPTYDDWWFARFDAVDLPSGKVAWSFKVPETQHGWSVRAYPPDVTGLDALILTLSKGGTGDTRFIAIDPETGAELSRADFARASIAWEMQAPSRGTAHRPPDPGGSWVTPRSDLIVVTEEAVLSVRPESLSDPRWVTPVAPYARVMISGDVVFIGDTPHRRSDGTALEWQADVEPGYSGGLRQFAGRLYDTGDGSTLTPVDPMSGEPCGETIAVRSVTEGPNGLFVIDDAGTIAEYDRSATRVRTLGTATGEAYGVLGGRFTEALDDGDLLVHGENGTVEISGSIVGHSDRHVVTQPAEGGPLTLVDLDTGATVWTSDPRPSVEIWAGYVQTVTDDILLKKVEFLRGAP